MSLGAGKLKELKLRCRKDLPVGASRVGPQLLALSADWASKQLRKRAFPGSGQLGEKEVE
jgi:hypothetical protein